MAATGIVHLWTFGLIRMSSLVVAVNCIKLVHISWWTYNIDFDLTFVCLHCLVLIHCINTGMIIYLVDAVQILTVGVYSNVPIQCIASPQRPLVSRPNMLLDTNLVYEDQWIILLNIALWKSLHIYIYSRIQCGYYHVASASREQSICKRKHSVMCLQTLVVCNYEIKLFKLKWYSDTLVHYWTPYDIGYTTKFQWLGYVGTATLTDVSILQYNTVKEVEITMTLQANISRHE